MINRYEAITFTITFLLAGWTYLSAVNISGIIVSIVCLVLELYLPLLYGGKIKLQKFYLLWMPALVIMFCYADNLSTTVLAYNITYLVLVLFIIMLMPVAKVINLSIPLRILTGFSVGTLVFLLLEYLFPTQMKPIVTLFLTGDYLTSELRALEIKSSYSGLASSNNVVTFSAVILLSYALFYLNSKKVFVKWVLVVVALISILISGQRSNLFFVPLAFMITYFVQSDRNRINRAFMIAFSLGAVISIVLAFEPVLTQYRLFERVFASFSTYRSGGDISNGRSILYARALSLWSDKPLFGNGWFYFYSNNIGIIRRLTRSHVHNLFLELLCDVGVVGLIFILAPMVVIYIRNYKALRNEISEFRQIYKLTFTLQTFFFLDSMLHVTYYSTSILTIQFICLLLFLLAQNKEHHAVSVYAR